MSPFFTGPFTLRISDRFGLCTKATFTCVIPPLEPARNETGEHKELAGRAGARTSFSDDLSDLGVGYFFLLLHIVSD